MRLCRNKVQKCFARNLSPRCYNSDAETVLDEDSPLSPCVWTHTVVTENRRQEMAAAEACASSFSRQEADSGRQAPRRELLLSPASQLNVLSQISELADAQSRQPSARPETSRLPLQPQCTHVWAPAMETSKRKKNSSPVTSTNPRAKKQKMTKQKQPTRSQAERLAADMLDWETCSEGDLFPIDADDEEDQWVYEDISDSDFGA